MTKSFIIYRIASTVAVGPMDNGAPHSAYAKRYATFGGALRTATKWNTQAQEKGLVGPGPYGVAETEHYYTRVVRQVTKTNLISGKEYQEASNTLGFLSPSSEAYWSA